MWIYTPSDHKTEHRGRSKEIPIGPRAQAVLEAYLSADPDQYLFRPADAPRTRGRVRRYHYTKDAVRRAIRRACDRAGVETFSPHQIRHAFATRIRRQFGLDISRAMLGHADPRVTELYAERDLLLACEIASKVG